MDKKFVPHDNLSDDINKNIMQSELDGGLKLEDIDNGETIKVQTKNTLYTIKKISKDIFEISGNAKFCPEPIDCSIAGSTWGTNFLSILILPPLPHNKQIKATANRCLLIWYVKSFRHFSLYFVNYWLLLICLTVIIICY